MSQEVDSRVVEMRFDNANFEKNTKQTISTIDRLMEKLQFKGAEKGFEKLDAAAKDVDFATMQTSLDRLESKFSSLNIVATTALVNITNKFVDAGEKLVKSLSIDQVASGWDKYTEKTSNVQTIMNATGKSIDQVNGYLNKLMWYSDETSYSFSEMTSALSQMTAAGGNIDKMIPMIMGIANATADAGKTGFAFQSTIRNLTQSYSAGHLQLQDWKSLNLMGTATKALKQELIDTAVELGVIKEGEVTIASFESSLQKKWANTEVMEKTFAKYASMMEAAYVLKTCLEGKSFELPIAMDVEDPHLKSLPAAELTKLVKMELREIEKWGLYAILYTYSNFADYNLNMWQLNDFDLWLADYRNKRPTRKHGMWQYSSKGNVAGVSGVVDMNHVYKDYPSIVAKAGLTSVKGA